MSEQIMVCKGCEKKFMAKSPRYFLCPKCAESAFKYRKCPICKAKLKNNEKVFCRMCIGGTIKSCSTGNIQCSHISEDGHQCGRFAMKGSYWCKDHQRK